MPADAHAHATSVWKAMTFSAVDDPGRTDDGVKGLFEPPRI
jgi:hypothetical protein